AWEWFEDPGITIRTVGAASGATRRSAEFEGPLVDYRAKGSTIELGEMADIGGQSAYRLVVTTMDGFVREYFIGKASYLVVAERRSAPFHAFGEPVTTETRFLDYRPVAGVLFAHRSSETVIATGETLTSMQWGSIQANLELPLEWFSPPSFERTDLQLFLEQLYACRTDSEALLWTWAQFRRYHPEIDTRAGIELIGYQILKMGEVDQALALLAANASAYPGSASSAFALGRAQLASGNRKAARSSFETALTLDPTHSRARTALTALEDVSESGR
ncbi:MAG: tetratricopeptide repeat protein, partial [Acidobacteriota bacterium]